VAVGRTIVQASKLPQYIKFWHNLLHNARILYFVNTQSYFTYKKGKKEKIKKGKRKRKKEKQSLTLYMTDPSTRQGEHPMTPNTATFL